MAAPVFQMREACRGCASPYGYIEKRGEQSCVFCGACQAWVYNAPKTETGERLRSVSTVHRDIKPRTRMAVFSRANGHCEICGADGEDRLLHVGHLISVDDGLLEGLSEKELNHQENLAAMCEECNLGLGRESVTVRMLMRLALKRQVRRATA